MTQIKFNKRKKTLGLINQIDIMKQHNTENMLLLIFYDMKILGIEVKIQSNVKIIINMERKE